MSTLDDAEETVGMDDEERAFRHAEKDRDHEQDDAASEIGVDPDGDDE